MDSRGAEMLDRNPGGNIALGIDVGGTFTDILAIDLATSTIVAAFKIPSTPSDPAVAAVSGVDRLHARTGKKAARVFHGTTVGTNTLIERRGALTAFVTTKGFRDVLALRRQARPRLYDLRPVVSEPLASRELRIEVDERTLYDGTVEKPISTEEIDAVAEMLRKRGVEAVAVSLLHAYANDEHERLMQNAIGRALPTAFVTCSSDVCREFREFERASTTAVNAYIGPAVARYIENLEGELGRRGIAELAITKSNGGLTSAVNARRFPVHLIESGPAAGVVATAALGRAEGFPNLIAFDMGGTTAKAGVVVDGEPRLSTEFYADRFVDGRDVGGYPILSPVIDIIEIGAGGGSIAHLDRAGVMKVGPESAGATPGPAVYGKGGECPTVTDAHVVLGHIGADGFENEDIRLHPELAESAIGKLVAEPLGWTVREAAHGILRLATANMAEMVRLATLRRGLDPRDFALVAFGGAGPLHACEIAREVGIPKVLVPLYPGLFSAIGALMGERRHDLVQTYMRPIAEVDAAALQAGFDSLKLRARNLIAAERVDASAAWSMEYSIDARFEGQLFELAIPVQGDAMPAPTSLERRFRDRHVEIYGYDLAEHTVEIVNLRLIARSAVWSQGGLAARHSGQGGADGRRQVWAADGTSLGVPVVQRHSLKPDRTIQGPAIIEDVGATVRVLEGQVVRVLKSGVLEIEVDHVEA
jgi:N-methylhydantoinase A